MNLGNFINDNMESILYEWQEFANSLDTTQNLDDVELRDHAKVMLLTVAQDLMSPQTATQQHSKSVGGLENPGNFSQKMQEKASSHGLDRLNQGFSIQELISEFRALRASVLRLWENKSQQTQISDLTEINRFNESIDQLVAESVDVFASQKEKNIRLFDAALSATPEHNYILDGEGKFLFVNNAMSEQIGTEATNILGKNISEFQAVESKEWNLAFEKVMQNKIVIRGEFKYGLNVGRSSFYDYIITPVLDSFGEVEAIAVTERDITDRKLREEAVWRQANFDLLTTLPNRKLFLDRLDQQIKNTERSITIAALFFIDLDNFKDVNDNFGHDAGDNMLRQVATRLIGCVRQNDTVARFGGDEFTVILAEFEHVNHVEKMANIILAELNKPFNVFGHIFNISGSIGISLIPNDAIIPEELISNADKAMYEAKSKGRNQYSFYSY